MLNYQKKSGISNWERVAKMTSLFYLPDIKVSHQKQKENLQVTNPYVAKTTKRAHSDFGQPVLLNTVLCIEDAHHELYDVQNVKRLKLT